MDIIKEILENTPPLKTKLRSCLKKENCPMREACLIENIIYYAKISGDDDEKYKPKLCKGICKTKKLYTNYVEQNKNYTKLSTEYWKIAN